MHICGYVTCSSIMVTQSTNVESNSLPGLTKPKRRRKDLSRDEKISIIKELETSVGRGVVGTDLQRVQYPILYQT